MLDPVVIDPPDFDQKSAWNECREYVDKCGGLSHEDGEPNWRAAFGADPGVCSCPACDQYYWMWGRRQRCVKCGFEYETDAWPQYSYGTQDAMRIARPPENDIQARMIDYASKRAAKNSHPYYRYGFDHPVDEPYEEFKRIDWRSIFPTK